MYRTRGLCLVLAMALFAATGFSAALTDSLKAGKADLKSVSVLTFGPEGILFVGDSIGATLYALDTDDRTPAPSAQVNVKGINEKIAALLGTMPDQIAINEVSEACRSHTRCPRCRRRAPWRTISLPRTTHDALQPGHLEHRSRPLVHSLSQTKTTLTFALICKELYSIGNS